VKLLVFGKTGQVARELAQRCPADVQARFLGRDDADLSSPQTCAEAVLASGADAVINAAAWTAVDQAEEAEPDATVINGDAPGAMARACARMGIPLLHISTDYVFDGTGTQPFAPDHPTAPVSAYGRSKLAGEEAIRDSGARHLILRTSWVVSAHGANFVKTMLRLGAERDSLRVVADQIGGPTPAAAIADALHVATAAMVAGHAGGTFHFTGAPDVSWADFARAIMQAADLPCRIEDIPTSDYPTPAQRPLNSRLDCTSFEREFGISRPDWKAGLHAIVTELGAAS
jgi:dTDP-4-dehydrorhamnose reductase